MLNKNNNDPTVADHIKRAMAHEGHQPRKKHEMSDGTVYIVQKSGAWKKRVNSDLDSVR